MDNINFIKNIKVLLAEGETELALNRLFENLNEFSVSIVKDATLIKSRFRKINDDFNIRGLMSREEYDSRSVQISYSILELLEKIEKLNQVDRVEYDRAKGKLLHHIPKVMPLGKETRCVVRIAYDEKVLIEGFQMTEDSLITNIRIAKVMSVELIDFSHNPAFSVRAITSDEQFVESDEYSQWIFMVKPYQQGVHCLTLKVAVIEQIEGKERRKEIVLEKEIDIISSNVDAVKKVIAPTFEDSNYRLYYAAPNKRVLNFRRSTLSLIAILFAFIATATVGLFVKKYYIDSKRVQPQNSIDRDTLNKNNILDSTVNVQKRIQDTIQNKRQEVDKIKESGIKEQVISDEVQESKDTSIKKDVIVNAKSVPLFQSNEVKAKSLTSDTPSISQNKVIREIVRPYTIKIRLSDETKDSEVYVDGLPAKMMDWGSHQTISFKSYKTTHYILLKKGNEECSIPNVAVNKDKIIEPDCKYFKYSKNERTED